MIFTNDFRTHFEQMKPFFAKMSFVVAIFLKKKSKDSKAFTHFKPKVKFLIFIQIFAIREEGHTFL